MGRAPCCDKANVKKGPWSPEEDDKLKDYIEKNGTGGNWISLPQKAGLKRCGKSCRLRWLNYLRPNIRHGDFTEDEDRIICALFASIGSRWSVIAAQLPGRTDNDIKNYWNTKLKKKITIPQLLHRKSSHDFLNPTTSSISQLSVKPMFANNNVHCYYMNDYGVRKECSNYNMMIYGHEAASSSSDGSCVTNNNQANSDYSNRNQLVLMQSNDYFGNHSCSSSSSAAEAQGINVNNDDVFGMEQQQFSNSFNYYRIEEIKQLMSSSGVNYGNNFDFAFGGEDIKAEE